MVRAMTVLGVLLAIAGAQTERWVYRYDGPRHADDAACSVVYGPDGYIYVAGQTASESTWSAFTIISLTVNGDERWVYRCHQGVSSYGGSLVYGDDGNLYAAGCIGESTARGGWNFALFSVATSGTERWVYEYNGAGNGADGANAVIYGRDGNIYAAGYTVENRSQPDFTVVSTTAEGVRRWMTHRNGDANLYNYAYCLVQGADDNIYVGGETWNYNSGSDYTIMSFLPDGGLNWIRTVDGSGGSDDRVTSIVWGADGNLYVAGRTTDPYTSSAFSVLSFAPSDTLRWNYRYWHGARSYNDGAWTVTYGADSNVYAAGSVGYAAFDFAVMGLTSHGGQRWVYQYDDSNNALSNASDIVLGADGNIYASGFVSCCSLSGDWDFVVVSLDTGGARRWIYRFNGPADSTDEAYALIYGTDGNVYCAGYSTGNGTGDDFTVISLDPRMAVNELDRARRNMKLDIALRSIQSRSLTYAVTLSGPARVSLSLRDLQGRKLASWQVAAPEGTSQHAKNLPDLSAGVYFLNAEAPGKGARVSRKLIVLE